MKTEGQTLFFINSVAARQGWEVNNEFIDSLTPGLTKNFNTYGYYLCPCRDGSNSREQDKDIICPCSYAAADIKEFGHCYCALYLSPDFKKTGRQPQSIPERRDN